MRRFAVALMFLSTACDGADEPKNDKLEVGYTECGDITCSPGQYCWAPGLCENGCTSDANCLDSDECLIDDTFFDEGSCYPRQGGTEQPPQPQNDLAACQAACEDFQSCGLSPSETSGCIDDCEDLTPTQQRVVGNCGDLTCGATLDCLGLECFTDDDCNGNRSCVGNSCL